MTKHLVVLTGAGMSAESGLKTFRDSNGLWEGHNVYEVATPEGFYQNPKLVLEFYNQRRRQLKEVKPNAGHLALAQYQDKFDMTIVTQNVDDLHERAGSNKVVHLHGELLKAKSSLDDDYVVTWHDDIKLGDKCPLNGQMRPDIVWFGEQVPMLPVAAEIVANADIVLIIGTSLQVYPAASLVEYAKADVPVYYLDPKPDINYALKSKSALTIVEDTAANGLPSLLETI